MTVADPGLRFWLRFVEQSGGLHEPASGGSLVVLPSTLQEQFGLPEDLAVTADPDVAREDGAVLLTPGHPALEHAARQVLDDGDVGRVALQWPERPAPANDVLLARAREQFPVDHGRLDAADPPVRRYRPFVRVGALVDFEVAGDQQYAERAEVWVDAVSQVEPPAGLHRLLTRHPWGEAASVAETPGDVEAAVRAADLLLRARSGSRLAALEDDAAPVRDAELQRARSYYAEALAGIERRLSTAGADRHALLHARAEATRQERARRLSEITDKHRSRLILRPYRLHVVLAPSLEFPAVVLRGARRYPITLSWLLTAGTFADLPCPSCHRVEVMVASKERLGCVRCLPPRPHPAAPATAGPTAAAPRVPAAQAPTPTPVPRPTTPAPTRPRPAGTVSRPKPPPPSVPASKIDAVGTKLAVSLWQAVAARDRRLRRMIAPDSPAATALRLYGFDGPRYAAGIPAGAQPASISCGMARTAESDRHVVAGTLEPHLYDVHTPEAFRFALIWRLDGATPLAEEITEYASYRPERLREWWSPTPGAANLPVPPPPLPEADLDDVARELWRVRLAGVTLPLRLRCLTAWWRLPPARDGRRNVPPAVQAAAILRLVSTRAGVRITTTELAGHYGHDHDTLKQAERALQRQLTLSTTTVW